MKNRPIPILIALLYHVLACAYGISQLPRAIDSGAFGVGQLVGLGLFASALLLLLIRPNIGRWLTVALFAFGAVFCGITILVLILKGAPLLNAWKLCALLCFFLVLGYFLAFGSSTKAYVSRVRA